MKRYCMIVALLGVVLVNPAKAEGEDSMSIGQRFHYETGFSEKGYKGERISWGEKVPLYKRYGGVPKVKLPEADFEGMSVEQAIGERRSERDFTDQSISLEMLGQVLLSADGITYSGAGYDFRAAPSGGALYPIEVYVIAGNVDSLADGLYHFQVSDSSLELIRKGDFRESAHKAANEQDAVGSSPVTIILTARFDRSTVKYADRGYRYIYIEAGAISENVYLQATSLGLGTVVVGAFNDDVLNGLLGIDGVNEAALLLMPLGFPR